jgi:macrolide-specific efflux system membrane fusion protein
MPAAADSSLWTEEPALRRHAWRWLPALALLLGGALAGWAWWRRRAAAAPAPLPAITRWVRPEARRLPQTVTTSGTIRLRDGAQVRVGSQVSGIVTELNVAVGSPVTAGEVIARIDPRPLTDRLRQAQAQVAQDEVQLGKARRDQQRGRALLAAGVLPRQQAEDLDWAVRGAQAALDSARAAVAAAQTDLAYSVIRAPVSGTVASVSTQQGETVAAAFASPTFVTIVQPRALELDGLVDETDIGNIRPGDAVTYTVETFPDRLLQARVTRIAPAAVIISGVVNYSVIASLREIPAFLRADMTANLTIRTGVRTALTIPPAALQRDPAGNFVWLARRRSIVRQPVAVGERGPGWIEITSGLRPEDRIGVKS